MQAPPLTKNKAQHEHKVLRRPIHHRLKLLPSQKPEINHHSKVRAKCTQCHPKGPSIDRTYLAVPNLYITTSEISSLTKTACCYSLYPHILEFTDNLKIPYVSNYSNSDYLKLLILATS